ncbi:MAG: hypothetical protein M1819_005441 [Sarea resinae]|nr:MAG: hypothetical protein M1819_005441 [Sarea resinae]
MLGQLFHRIAPSGHSNSSTPRASTSLESVTEDAHTRNLLFPDPALLSQSQDHAYPLYNGNPCASTASLGAYDDVGEIDMESGRDVRILIAQDSTSSLGKTVLFDSKPPPPKPVTARNSMPLSPLRNGEKDAVGRQPFEGTPGSVQSASPTRPRPISGRYVRRPSLPPEDTQQQTGSISGGAFHRARLRNASMSSTSSAAESTASRLAREGEEEVRTLLDCMFGSAVLSYKGPSTKMHILPSDNGSGERSGPSSPLLGGDGPGSFGRADGKRRSQLSSSYTPANPPQRLSPSHVPGSDHKSSKKKTVLITRMFSVNLPETNARTPSSSEPTPTQQDSASSYGSYFSQAGLGGSSKPVKQRKTPMYAVAIILQLPASHNGLSHGPRSGQKMLSSSFGQISVPSSLESDKHSGWTVLEPKFGLDSSALQLSDCDDHMDIVVRHWDVITRTLSRLQTVSMEKIYELLRIAEIASPQTEIALKPPFRGERDSPLLSSRKLQRSTQRSVQLTPNSLASDEFIRRATEHASSRIVRGIKTPKVLTGQGRWGVWREEARWVGRWAGNKEQNFFFFNLLTAFLGNHTEWLNTLGPSWYRRRHYQQQRASSSEDTVISSRTIIVSTDKIAARRLIFLLSAFLPGTTSSQDAALIQRPSTSTSFKGYSQSPPTSIPIRKASLRRTLGKRGAPHATEMSRGQSANGTLASPDGLEERIENEGLTTENQPLRYGQLSRSSSRRSDNFAGTSTNDSTKSCIATTSAITPSATIPIPHFATNRDSTSARNHSHAELGPGSGDSLASQNLMHTLKRSESTNNSNTSGESHSARGWGSLISGFWSNRRTSLTTDTDINRSSSEGLSSNGVQKTGSPSRPVRGNKLAQMVAEVSRPVDDGELYQEDVDKLGMRSSSDAKAIPEADQVSTAKLTRPEAPSPSRSKKTESSLKLSVDENDGVIDVDIPMPSFLTSSFGSPLQSPSTGGFMSISSLEGTASSWSQASACPFSSAAAAEPESCVNVAGWLKRYHEDFSFQAVRPYASLEEEIKASMRAEPTPPAALSSATTPEVENVEFPPTEKWVDVATTLIADAQTFSIKRIRLRRRVALAPPIATPTPDSQYPGSSYSQYGNPYTAAQLSPPIIMSNGSNTTDQQQQQQQPPPSSEAQAGADEEFSEEQLMDIDSTLIDAVERVLALSGPPSAASSRSSSLRRVHREAGFLRERERDLLRSEDAGSANGKSMNDNPPSQQVPFLEIPRSECRRQLLGALEQVVRSVAADKEGTDGGGGPKYGPGSGPAVDGRERERESTLREGIRRWLGEVEDGF